MIGSLEGQITQWQAWSRTDKEHLRSNETTIARLEAENARLREALEPFAEFAKGKLLETRCLGMYLKARWEPITWHGEHDITPANLQRAIDAVSPDREVKG